MTWLTPITGLILAACIVPPLVFLYFLKLRRRPLSIASTLLWQRSVEDLQANAPFQRLRKSLLLFLQLLVVVLLVLAVMQPQIQGTGATDGRTVIFIDNSASMTAIDLEDGTTRLDAAKDMARSRVESMYSGGMFSTTPGETMVIAFSDRAEIQARFTRSKEQLLNAIDRIEPTHGETKINQALQLARAYTTDTNPDGPRPIAEPADYIVYSDGKIADLADQVLRRESLEFIAIGTDTADNVAIGQVSLERPYERPTQVEVFASVVNFNSEPVVCDIQLSVDNTAVSIVQSTIAGSSIPEGSIRSVPGRANVVFPAFEMPRGAVLEVACLRTDDLAADNTGQLVLAPPRQLNVAVVGSGTNMIVDALEGMSLASINVMDKARFLEYVAANEQSRFDVIMILNEDLTNDLESMPPGRYLTFGAPPPVTGLNPFGEGLGLFVLHYEKAHPIMAYVPMDQVTARDYHKLQPDADIDVIAEGAGGNAEGTGTTTSVPIIVQVSRGDLQLIHVVFSPMRSGWPVQFRSFVTFLYNAIDYLGHYGEGIGKQGFRPGQAITARLPLTATEITLQIPNGEIENLTPLSPEMISWGPVRESGLYLLSWREPDAPELQQRVIAANLVTDFEGDIRSQSNITIGQDSIEGATGKQSQYTALWPFAVGLCLAMLLFEWWIYHRKMTI